VLEIHLKTGADLPAYYHLVFYKLASGNTAKTYGNVHDQEILPNKVGGPGG